MFFRRHLLPRSLHWHSTAISPHPCVHCVQPNQAEFVRSNHPSPRYWHWHSPAISTHPCVHCVQPNQAEFVRRYHPSPRYWHWHPPEISPSLHVRSLNPGLTLPLPGCAMLPHSFLRFLDCFQLTTNKTVNIPLV